jgi:hypothetical protein
MQTRTVANADHESAGDVRGAGTHRSVMWRRFHPFRPDRDAQHDPPFDPRRQSWAAGALSAIEAFTGALLALPGLSSVAFVCYWLLLSPSGRESHHFHAVTPKSLLSLAACSVLAASLLWAGLSLMFGGRSRYRAHGVLGLVVVAELLLYGALWLARSALAFQG